MSNQNILEAVEYQPEVGDENATLPQTYIVLRCASDIPDKAVTWLVDKIRAKRRDGGSELMVFHEPYNPEEVNSPTAHIYSQNMHKIYKPDILNILTKCADLLGIF